MIKFIAPIIPFSTEKMYSNLVVNMDSSARESVHLCDFPKCNEKWIDYSIIKKVDALKKVVELGRSARNHSKQKIRQPLSKVLFALEDDEISDFIVEHKYIVLDELNVKSIERITNADSLVSYIIKPNLPSLGKKYSSGLKSIREILNSESNENFIEQYNTNGKIILENNNDSYILEKEDVFIETVATEGFSAVSGSGMTVGLKLELNDDLIQEGIVRDLVRMIQNIRKEAGLAVEDRIILSWDLDKQFSVAFSKFRDYFCNETLTVKIEDYSMDADFNSTISIKDKDIKVAISKV